MMELMFNIGQVILIISGYEIGNWIFRMFRRRHREQRKPRAKPAFFYCACGCGRDIHKKVNWDGYHGPDFSQPVDES